MSALLVDDLDVLAPHHPQPRRWRHAERGPEARPQLVVLPGGRPGGVAAPRLSPAPVAGRAPTAAAVPAPAPLRLTDRGIAVVVVSFLALLVTAAVVLVGGFLAVSDAPLPAGQAIAGSVSGRS